MVSPPNISQTNWDAGKRDGSDAQKPAKSAVRNVANFKTSHPYWQADCTDSHTDYGTKFGEKDRKNFVKRIRGVHPTGGELLRDGVSDEVSKEVEVSFIGIWHQCMCGNAAERVPGPWLSLSGSGRPPPPPPPPRQTPGYSVGFSTLILVR